MKKRKVYEIYVDYMLSRLPEMKEMRFKGDYTACVELIDFMDVINNAGLTERQREIFEYLFIKDWTHEYTAEVLRTSRPYVTKEKNNIVNKLVDKLIEKVGD